MSIEYISISNSGYVHCKSSFYSVHDILNENKTYEFLPGLNVLYGDIDSGNWAISYLLSMFDFVQKTTLFMPFVAKVNGECTKLDEFKCCVCYMDKSYPLFSTADTVQDLISNGIEKNNCDFTVDEVRALFSIDEFRFRRPLSGLGNELYKAMAAIGYCYNKQVYCFPWFSKVRFDSFHYQIIKAISVLESLGKVIILPLGNDNCCLER